MINLIYSTDRRFHFSPKCSNMKSEYIGSGFPIWVHKAKPCEICAAQMIVYVSKRREVYHLLQSCIDDYDLHKNHFAEIFNLKFRPCTKCADDVNLLNLWQISVES